MATKFSFKGYEYETDEFDKQQFIDVYRKLKEKKFKDLPDDFSKVKIKLNRMTDMHANSFYLVQPDDFIVIMLR